MPTIAGLKGTMADEGTSVMLESRAPSPADTATPMIAQYLEIKAANADCLLFYRMGDFYELFFDDAATASRALGIALTKRGKYLGQDIPMCGVPVHAADDYLQRLISQGHRVAVCEQIEDPAEARKRGPKSVVRRDVVRLVTPGTLTEDTLLDAHAHNFLTAIFRAPGREESFALASLDISTGELLAGAASAADLPGELARLRPGEVLLGDDLASDAQLRRQIEDAGASLTPVPRAHFSSVRGERALWRPPHLCRDHASREGALPACAPQRECRNAAPHRCGDPRQSGTDALQPGRPGRELARRH
jgi:DNA mismatch repair protein MutS